MRKTSCIGIFILPALIALAGCRSESKVKDRTEATEMFGRIVALTEEYTDKMTNVSDSAEWSELGKEFEDKLDKINFSYPPDTDLLMTEGQNDTITALMAEYVNARDRRFRFIIRPYVPVDTVPSSLVITESDQE